MPSFEYEATDRRYEEHSGRIEAESLPKAASELKDSGLFPHSLAASRPSSAPRSEKEAFAVFNRALAGMVRLRIPLSGSLRTLAGSLGSRTFREAVSEVADSVEAGTPLDRALEQQGGFFPALYVHLVRAGLASGDLSTSLTAIAHDVEERLALKRIVWSELTYPLMVFAFAAVIVGVLTVVALPGFARGTAALEVQMPGIARHFIDNCRTIGIGILVLLFLLAAARRTRLLESLRLHFLPAGRILRSLALTRFYTCLDTLLKSGRFDPTFLTAAAQASGNRRLQRRIAAAAEGGWEGEATSEIIRGTHFFGAGDADMLAFGEGTGTFPQAVRDLAELHREHLKSAVSFVSGILPVVFALVLGAVLGTLYVSLAYPYVHLIMNLQP